MELKGKCVLITGGARRLGRQAALRMARAGANVAITYRESRAEADQTVDELAAFGVRALSVQCDVRRAASVRKAVDTVVRRLGGIDVLVNNAGVYETAPFDEITPEQWTRVFESNLRGPYLVAQAAQATLRRRRGRIINMGSLGGIEPWTSHAHYCSTKAGLHHLSRIMAKALAPEIAVNCVAPGMIDLDQPENLGRRQSPKQARETAAFFRKMSAQTPMRRNGTAEDITAAVLFFATAPHFITGQMLVVDGGLDLA